MKSAEPKLLMIINEFPPVGESGVQRPLKHLKYLSRAGWKCFVVTPGNPPKAVFDYSLLDEIPRSASIHRTFSFGFGGRGVNAVAGIKHGTLSKASLARKALWKGLWKALNLFNSLLFPIDKQIGWVPFAYRKALSLIRSHGIRNVYITAFPFSAFLVGIMLKRKLGNKITWVADYRDAWQFEPLLKENILPFRYRKIERKDRQVLELCDRVVFPTEHIHKLYLQKYPWLSDKSVTITNGYDEEDFTGLIPRKYDKFTVFFMGKVYNPKRSNPLPFIEAIAQSHFGDLSIVHAGSVSQDVKPLLEQHPIYRFEGYKSHRAALECALGADVNLIVLNDDAASEGVYTGKLFELLRIGKPILAL
ncbi:MAG: glycosyltransferase, partial [Candidatus Cloacimonadaceae bacterium]|nr:glycosyltransferase [Candidatus Cloacimonadaceae bacterium]